MKKATLLILLFCLSSPAFAASDQELEQTIRDVIVQRHPTDTPDWWRSLGPNAPKVMIELYEKTSTIYQRLRLVEALGWYDDPVAVEFLKKQAQATSDDVIRNGAIRSIGNSQGASEIDFISKFLDHDDPQTRMAAGLALKQMQNPRANALLQKFYEKETQPWVRDKIKNTPISGSVSHPPKLRIEAAVQPPLQAEFTGAWKGFLIWPAQDSLKSDTLDARLKIENANSLTGEVSIRIAGRAHPVVLNLDRVKGKEGRISGFLLGEDAKVFGEKSPASFQGELLRQSKAIVLRIEFRATPVTIVLKKTP